MFTVDVCSKIVKAEEANDSVTWSDHELDVPGDGDDVAGNDLCDASLACDGQKESADAMYVCLNGDQCTDSVVFQFYRFRG